VSPPLAVNQHLNETHGIRAGGWLACKTGTSWG